MPETRDNPNTRRAFWKPNSTVARKQEGRTAQAGPCTLTPPQTPAGALSRRHLLGTAALLCALLVPAHGAGDQHPEEFTLLHITDTHVCDLKGHHSLFVKLRGHHEVGAEVLRDFLLTVPRKTSADAVIITGDLIDFYATEPRPGEVRSGQIDYFAKAVGVSPVPVWMTLGNHDIGSLTIDPATGKFKVSRHDAHKARAKWIREFECFRNGTHYAVARTVGDTKFRLVFLDNYFPLNTGESNFFGDRFQMDWLAYQLRQDPDERIVVFTHIPIRIAEPDSNSSEPEAAARWESVPKIYYDRFLQLLDEHPSVVAVVAGHRHENVIETVRLPSGRELTQVQTADLQPDPGNWRIIRLTEKTVEISYPESSESERKIGLHN